MKGIRAILGLALLAAVVAGAAAPAPAYADSQERRSSSG